MKCKYRPQDYAQRLDHTWCRYKGIPVYVRVQGDRISGSYDCQDYFVIQDLEDFDISSLELGYVNHRNKVSYVTRVPSQRYKQGVCSSNVSFEGIAEGRSAREAVVEVTSTAFKNMLNGVYPPLEKVLKNLSEGEVAISRDIAISTDILGVKSVFYKQKLVGWIAPGTKVVNIPSGDLAHIVSYFLEGLNWEIN